MNLQAHILAALQEQLETWEALLASLSQEQIESPLSPSPWSIKDVLVHLWAWQQRSIARLEAARLEREPEFPQWAEGKSPDDEDSTDRINDWIYQTYRNTPWAQVYTKWREGYRRFMELGGMISERNLLAFGLYPWMKDNSLGDVLLASYDHHQEHLEVLLEWLGITKR
jgi:hypothetical protein